MRVLLIDNERLMLDALQLAFEVRHPGLEIRTAATESAALELADSAEFDLILLDWWLGDRPAESCLASLQQKCPRARVVILSGDDSSELVGRVLGLHAVGFVPKNAASFDELRRAIDIVVSGGIYLPGNLPSNSNVSPSVRPGWKGRELDECFPQLTPRQLSTLRLLLRGWSNKVIAVELGIEPTTAKDHVEQVIARLDAKNRAEVVVIAARLGARID